MYNTSTTKQQIQHNYYNIGTTITIQNMYNTHNQHKYNTSKQHKH